MTTDEYMQGILAGNITVLSQAITLVESLLPEHYAQAQEIIERCLPHSGRSVRIGITGVPGAGKSTFIEAIGDMVAGTSGTSFRCWRSTRVRSAAKVPSWAIRPGWRRLCTIRAYSYALPLGRFARRGGPQRRAKPSFCAKPRGSTLFSSRRSGWGSPRRPCIRWSICFCCCRSPAPATNCRDQARHHGDGRYDRDQQGRRRQSAACRCSPEPLSPNALNLFPMPDSRLASESLHLLRRSSTRDCGKSGAASRTF